MSHQAGRQMRLRPETEQLIKRHRKELLEHGAAYAVHALVHEALGLAPPATPNELKAEAALKQQAAQRRERGLSSRGRERDQSG